MSAIVSKKLKFKGGESACFNRRASSHYLPKGFDILPEKPKKKKRSHKEVEEGALEESSGDPNGTVFWSCKKT